MLSNFFIFNTLFLFKKKIWFRVMHSVQVFTILKTKTFFLDIIYLIVISFFFKTSNLYTYFTKPRLFWRLQNSSNNFFFFNLKNVVNNNYFTFLYGLKFVWIQIRFWFLSLLLGISICYFLIILKNVHLVKISFQWLAIVMFLYWLMSGFSFFLKKYKTSKFTTVIQRFWRRSYILFWLIETSVFVTFLYLTINSSQEPFYMFDQVKFFKTHLFSWRYFLLKIIFIALLIVLSSFCLLNLKWNIFSKQSTIFFFITLFLTYIVWIEFYQFIHVINFYGYLIWNFDSDDRIWVLDVEFRRTRLVNNYVALCLLAKFWHLIFIYVFWVFFIIRSNEFKRYRYPFLSSNLQNFIILYTMSWLYMYPWFKYGLRRYLDYSYYWFFVNTRDLFVRIFFNDVKLFYFGFLNRIFNFNLFYFFKFPFMYWYLNDYTTCFYSFGRHFIKDKILFNFFTSF